MNQQERSRPLRIAFINPSGEVGGAERSLMLLLGGLDRQRYAPTVFCSEAGRFMQSLRQLGVPAEVVPLGPVERLSRFGARPAWLATTYAALGIPAAVTRLAQRLGSHSPDLVHTNGIKAHFLGGLAGRLLRRPVIWHVRDLVPPESGLRLLLACADRLPTQILANSRAVAEQFAGRRAAIYTHVVHNAVDLEGFRPTRAADEVRRELNLPSDAIVLAMVAHFTRWKGHLLFLEVLAQLLAEGVPVAGLVIGASIYRTAGHEDYEAEVRARCRSLGLEDRVRFTGYQERVADYLNAADMLLHPPTRPEPFGRAAIEAMALGKPVVAAAAGGLLEIVVPEETGILVPPGDKLAFVAAVRGLATDPERRAALGASGRERAARHFSPSAHVAEVERIYRQALDPRCG